MNAYKPPTPNAYIRDTRRAVIPDVKRWAVHCWDTIQAYAHSRPPAAIVCVLAATQEGAQDHIRSRYSGFDAVQAHIATDEDIAAGMTLSEFRNRYNTT